MMIWESILPALNSFACLGLGLFVYTRKPKQFVNRLFLATMIGAAGVEAIGAVSMIAGIDRTMPRAYQLYTTILVATLCLAGAFSMVFGRRDPIGSLRRWRPLLIVQAAAGAAVIVQTWTLSNPVALSGEAGVPILAFSPYTRWMLVFTAFSLMVVIFHMEKLFSMTAGKERWQVKYAVLGIAAASFFYLLVNALAISRLSLRVDLIPANSFIFLCSQGLLLFAIVRHRLLYADVFISREVSYRAFLTVSAILYFVLVGLFGFWSQSKGGKFGLVLAAGGVFFLLVGGVVVLLSEHVRNSVRHFINTHFYRNKYEYRSKWNSFTEQLSRIDNLDDLGRIVLQEISETMWVNRSSLWQVDEGWGEYFCSAAEGVSMPGNKVGATDPLIETLREAGQPARVSDLLENDEIGRRYGRMLQKLESQIISPLIVRDRVVGFITLGPNLFGQTFDYEDQEMLKTLCSQAASAIYRLILAEELATARGLESLNRVSTFILHDLKNTVSMLSMVAQNAAANLHKPEFQKDTVATISRSVNKIRRLAEKFSFPKSEVAGPKFSAVDLNRLVEEALKRLQLKELEKISIIREYGDLPSLSADPEMVGRLLDNLLVNAIQALSSKGGEIRLRTGQNGDGMITVEVADNGCGMAEEVVSKHLFKPFHTTKEKGLGIGLYHCKSIVEIHGGKIEVESRPDEGSVFRVFFPADRVLAGHEDHEVKKDIKTERLEV